MSPDGKMVPMLASATPLVTNHGLGGAIVVYQDIRSLKELERLREEWAAIVAHDLRQPLGVISLTASSWKSCTKVASPTRRERPSSAFVPPLRGSTA